MGAVERRSVRELSARDFVESFGELGRPLVLLDAVPSWPAFAAWNRPDGTPDFAALAAQFRGLRVPVVDCGLRGDDSAVEPSWEVTTWDSQDYFSWAGEQREQAGDNGTEQRLLYLKDWHFARDCQSLGLTPPYEAPDFLDSPLHDWLNAHMDAERRGEDDYRFCYVGVAGTRTPLHHDVLFSHSWSASICGTKHWIFFPPEVSSFLLDARGEALASAQPCRRAPGWQDRCPRLEEAWAKRLELDQAPGELVFVPSGWYHEVENLTDVISINHNWMNANNAAQVGSFLKRELASVHKAIGHLRETFDSDCEYEVHCQTLMRANCGLDCVGWCSLLARGAEEVLRALELSQGQEQRWVALRAAAGLSAAAASLPDTAAPAAAAAAEKLVQATAAVRAVVQREMCQGHVLEERG